MVIDTSALDGYTPEALVSDLKFESTHRAQIGPMAMLSDGGWKEWLAKLSAPFYRDKVRHFEPDQLSEAKVWGRSQSGR